MSRRRTLVNTDRVGNKYGRWEVISVDVPFDPYGKPQVLVRCKCGREKIVAAWTLHKGLSTSCGCYVRDIIRQRAKKWWHDGRLLTAVEIAAETGERPEAIRQRFKRRERRAVACGS